MSLQLKNISCGYNGNSVLDNICFSIEPGEFVCLLGPNGIGKTTLFKTLLGLLKAIGGRVLINDVNLDKISYKERAGFMAYVPQHCEVFFPYRVIDMVLMGRAAALNFKSSPGKKDYNKAFEALEALSIKGLAEKVYNRLSGGEKQLVLIARALCQESEYMVLDEPTSSLDFGNQALVLSEIKKLSNTGLGIFMTTHYPNHAFLSGSKVVLINKNKEIIIGTPEEVITSENMVKAYGIDTYIANQRLHAGDEIKYCIPVMS